MGESGTQGFQLSFNRFLRVGFQGSRVTYNGGLILVQELDGYCQVEQNLPVLRKDFAGSETENQ